MTALCLLRLERLILRRGLSFLHWVCKSFPIFLLF